LVSEILTEPKSHSKFIGTNGTKADTKGETQELHCVIWLVCTERTTAKHK